jgi:hypothetical protein
LLDAEAREDTLGRYPAIRGWIERNGGWQHLPLDGFWTMYDRDLWAMGYPKCK